MPRAEIIREKGTNRDEFMRGEADKYTWRDIGSSYSPSDMTAAFLLAQLEQAEAITVARLRVWNAYHAGFERLEAEGRARRPVVTPECVHNGHLYYLLVPGEGARDRLIRHLESRGVNTVFHYVPLHSSPAGRRHGRAVGELALTTRVSESLVRLPLWIGMDDSLVERVVDEVCRGVELVSEPGAASASIPRVPG